MGFDLEAGRLDVSAHPFCSGTCPRDVRLTTRFQERDMRSALFGSMHEAGHGLYEQGLDTAHEWTPMGSAVSLGIHESQSRLWENLVGRSRAFWAHWFPKLKETFPEALSDVGPDAFHFAINEVRPSLIRVEADEVTYNLHILLRFELEQELLSGAVSVSALPGVWNERMQRYLGITPPDDAKGCLQDIHWSFGLFGYFPTYTLGNLYASQIYAAARREMPDLEAKIAAGEMRPLREWLREKIHRRGMLHRPADLVREATGAAPSADFFTSYLKEKFGALYGV
jgi:carboxypeptidase Taq